MAKKALVTGGAGFIGSNLVDLLLKKGYEVTCLDNESSTSNDQFFRNSLAQNWCFDVLNYDLLLSSLEKYKFDYVFHLAAESRIQPTLERPQDACRVNFLGTCNILQAARQTGVKRVIYSSTSSAYGIKNTPPLTEDMSRDCLNPYSVSKVAAEDLCKIYYELWGLETVIFRYFNVYGERQPTKGQYAPVLGLFLKQKKSGQSLTIVGDGLQTRDFTHVSDVVMCNLLAAETENKEALGGVMNVGTGTETSVLDIAKMISSNYTFLPPRLGEARRTLANISKLKRVLNYEPKVKLQDWIRENDV